MSEPVLMSKTPDSTMINSRVFGPMSIENSKIIHFPKGIPGLDSERYFAFVCIEEYQPLVWMVSQGGTYHLPVVPLTLIDSDDLDEESHEVYYPQLMQILNEHPKTAAYVILKLDPSVSHLSLKAPIIVDVEEQRGEQYILDYVTMQST